MTPRLSRTEPEQAISEVTLAHLYRAEVSRSTQWRTRLDTTTNWAITTAAAVVSFAFSSPAAPHATVLVGLVLVFTFLVVEARRYRYYDLWARRVRLFETGYIALLLRREPVGIDFTAALAAEYQRPRLRIPPLDSLAFRLRRTYAPIIGLLLVAWIVKLDVHPRAAPSFDVLLARGGIGPVPGWFTVSLWGILVLGYVWLLFWGARRPLPPTELRAPARSRTQPLSTALRLAGREETPAVRRGGAGD